MSAHLLRHIYAHPWRLMATALVVLSIGWGLAGYALVRSYDLAHDGRVENCRAIDELNRELRLALIDAGYPVIAMRFEPTMNCESLP